MHAARLATSPRLQRLHALLADGAEHSTLDIVRGANVCAVNAAVAELRAQGASIDCRQTQTEGGARIWLYRMLRPGPGGRVTGYVDLFGDPADHQPPPVSRRARRRPRPLWRGLYADTPGSGPKGEQCRGCRHAWRHQPSSRAFYKCALQRSRWTCGSATDIRVAAPACSRWEPRR